VEEEVVSADGDASAESESKTAKTDGAGVDLGDEQKMIMQIARTVLEGLLEKMKVRAKVEASYIDNQEDKDEPVLLLDIVGDDLSILIGRRSETLNALQYITNLIVGKELGHWVPLIVDVQGYRIRRERQLRQLARRMADQAMQSGRRQTLEPMPSNERRLIHLELRDHADVVTRSVGEEPYRKVTISLK
jgi:spoIIIJ-associated protein